VSGKTSEVQVPRFLSDSALEVANGEVVDEGHLGLNPVSKGFVWEASGVKHDEFVGIDDFADLR
jgi:hypothetical protein